MVHRMPPSNVPPQEHPELLPDEVREHATAQVRLQADHVHDRPVVDLGSPGGFLALSLAEACPTWPVRTGALVPEQAPENLEHVEIDLPELPFEPGSLGLVTGAFLDDQLTAWEPRLVEAMAQALGPEGMVLLLHRGPSPNNMVAQRGLPRKAKDDLEAAGFENVEEARVSKLHDGSWIYRLQGSLPA